MTFHRSIGTNWSVCLPYPNFLISLICLSSQVKSNLRKTLITTTVVSNFCHFYHHLHFLPPGQFVWIIHVPSTLYWSQTEIGSNCDWLCQPGPKAVADCFSLVSNYESWSEIRDFNWAKKLSWTYLDFISTMCDIMSSQMIKILSLQLLLKLCYIEEKCENTGEKAWWMN